MSKTIRNLFAIALTLHLIVPRGSSAQHPTTLPAASQPAFQTKLNDEEFARRASLLDAPFTGAQIFAVNDGSPGAMLNLSVGDIIYEVDGHPITSDLSMNQIRNVDAPHQMRVWSLQTSSSRLLHIEPGLLGIQTGDYWNIANEYQHSIGRGLLDPNLLIAARAASTDYELAQTALAKANSQSPMALLIAAAAGYYDLQLKDCLSYATAAMIGLPQDNRDIAQLLAYRAALATSQWNLASKIGLNQNVCHHFETDNADQISYALKVAHIPPENSLAAFSDAFKSATWVDHTSDLAGTGSDARQKALSQRAVDQLHSSGQFHFSLPSDSYSDWLIAPGAENFDMDLRARFRSTQNTIGETDPYIEIAFMLGDKQDQSIELLLFENGDAQVEGSGIPVGRLNVNKFCGNDKPFSLHWTIVGQSYQIKLNDRPLYSGLLPFEQTNRDLRLWFHAVGITGQIDHFTWKTTQPATTRPTTQTQPTDRN